MSDLPEAAVTRAGSPARDEVRFHPVGPAGSMAADSAFAVALVTLWHRVVAQSGGAVGFAPSATRPEVAARAAAVVDDLQRGRAHGVAVTGGRALLGFGLLVPGQGVSPHTGRLSVLMIDPDRQGAGLGARLLTELLGLARTLELERIDLAAPAGSAAEQFFRARDFTEWGRRPGWIRTGSGVDMDEVHLARGL